MRRQKTHLTCSWTHSPLVWELKISKKCLGDWPKRGFIHLWGRPCLPLLSFFTVTLFLSRGVSCAYLLSDTHRFTDIFTLLSPSFPLSLSLSPSLHLHPASLYPISFWCMAVYLAFVETASLLEDSPGINLPCLCQATDQQFTGHQLLGLLGGCLTGILGVWHDRAFTAGIDPALNTKSATHKENLWYRGRTVFAQLHIIHTTFI